MLTWRVRYFVCRERKHLYNFVKQVYEKNLNNIEDSMLRCNDLSYTVQVLENARLFGPEIGERLSKTAKLVFHSNIHKLQTARLAVQVVNCLHPYYQNSDQDILDAVYKFYQTHPYLFDKKLIDRLQYYYYTLESKSEFEEPIQLEVQADVSNTRMYTPVAKKLYNIQLNKFWNMTIRYNPDKQTSVATLDHRRGQKLRIEGIFENNFEDLTDCKSLINEREFECVFLNQAPFARNQNSQGKMKVIKNISSFVSSGKPYKEETRHVFLEDLKEVVESYKKKFIIQESKSLICGVQQGFEVPYLFESLIYHFSKTETAPIILLTGLDFEERVKYFLGKSENLVNELQTMRMQWLNEMLRYLGQTMKFGCFSCGSQAERYWPPSYIMDEHPIVKKVRAEFCGEMVLNYMGSSGKSKFLLMVQESMFYETLKFLAENGLEENEMDIDSVRRRKVNSLLQNEKNRNFQEQFMQFYADQINIDRLQKVSENQMLDLNNLSKLKYSSGPQIKCGARELLF